MGGGVPHPDVPLGAGPGGLDQRVVRGAWMARFIDSPSDGATFVEVLCDAAEEDATPDTLDYVRLNLEATHA